MKDKFITIRVDEDLKAAFDEVLDKEQMTASQALRIFIKMSVLLKRFPLRLSFCDRVRIRIKRLLGMK